MNMKGKFPNRISKYARGQLDKGTKEETAPNSTSDYQAVIEYMFHTFDRDFEERDKRMKMLNSYPNGLIIANQDNRRCDCIPGVQENKEIVARSFIENKADHLRSRND